MLPYKHFLWITPFVSFLIGYWIVGSIFSIKTIQVPRVVGLPIHEGIDVLSEKKLNVRILAKKEDADLPVGTIIRQTPSPYAQVKPNHSIFLVTSKKPPTQTAPDLLNKDRSMISSILSEQKIKHQIVEVRSPYPTNTCVGQEPGFGEPIASKKMIVYISKKEPTLFIFPSCIDEKLAHVSEFLALNELTPSINYIDAQPNLGAHRYVVVDQKPLPGTLIDLSKKNAIQLLVKRK